MRGGVRVLEKGAGNRRVNVVRLLAYKMQQSMFMVIGIDLRGGRLGLIMVRVSVFNVFMDLNQFVVFNIVFKIIVK